MIVIWLFILVPLALFLTAYFIETYVSFRRLGNHKKDQSYLSATWEVTHTFLVASVALFVGFFSQHLTDVAYVAFYPLFLTSIFIGIRTLAYIYIFIIREPSRRGRRQLIDWIFAWSHLGVILGLIYLLFVLVPVLFTMQLTANTAFVPWMLPGLVALLVVCILPLLALYRTKK